MNDLKTIVWLDSWNGPDLNGLFHGVDLDFVTEKRLGNSNSRTASPDILLKIKGLCGSGKVDLIVIGDNKGAGIKKAECVSDDMKPKTIITLSPFTIEDANKYKKLGFARFMEPEELTLKEISHLLGLP